jgi:hypothetical protein
MITQSIYSTIVPQQLICQLIGGGVPERYPDLHFALIEFNAHWLASLVGSMDKCWVTGIGQDADWWLGVWDDSRPAEEQSGMAQLFRLNEKWPYTLMPNDYPHAEGTFRGSRDLLHRLFAGVPEDEKAAMVGGTLGGILGFTAPVTAAATQA